MNHWKRYTVTAALPYANGPKHIGHLAGAYLPADIYVRYLRAQKRDVVFICGSDEHGTAITYQAILENTTPRAIIDKYHGLIEDSFRRLGISFDIYHRTSEPLHHQTAQEFFLDFYRKGLFKEIEAEQYYDEEKQVFLADRYITGTCPNCSHDRAYGDQCEKCGKSLSPSELINPRSTLSGKPPVMRKTKHWYLPLNEYEPWLRNWLVRDHARDWKPNVYGQAKSWIDAGLQPRAMTRDSDWGVKVPLPDTEGKVLYVWFDAPIGYISATRQWAINTGNNWEPYWKDPDTRLIHFVGKDNIVFHCIIFPVMLHMHGDYILPDNVPANEFLNLEGDKMSTSRRWSVEMHEYLRDFPDKADELRYVLCSIAPETKDSEFTWKDFQTRVNSELVAIFGNLVNRVMVLCEKYFENRVPQANSCSDLENFITAQRDKISDALENFRFREALTEMMNVARHGNQLLSEKEPWKLIKTDREATANVLYDCLQIVANLGILCEPFLPFTARKIFSMLSLDERHFTWSDAGRQDLLRPGHPLGKASLLYQKIEDAQVEAQIAKLRHAAAAASGSAKENHQKNMPEISYETFAKMDLRAGTVIHAEKVEKADKLLKLTVNLGNETRTIVSGIAEYYRPEEVTGRQVCVVTNLAPRKIRGIESRGMILMAEAENGRLVFVAPAETIPAGAVIR
ncbi:MAG: methionine--tRNA ligase [Chitinophagales bacterium]|nr:methionine--tRNA ligase [Chitinophagales bacterium]MDW8417973.1 methionine--tRNA ligase [Chitinophagales bacterium]